MWSSPTQLTCERLIRNLSRALGSFKSNLENATAQDCVCQPGLGPVQQHVHRYALWGSCLCQEHFNYGFQTLICTTAVSTRVRVCAEHTYDFLNNIRIFYD